MITILGPTASGKTKLATQLAARIDGEILSADSRQVYRRMDIGTGKDLADYDVTIGEETIHIPYHLTNICEPGTKYNLFQYQRDFIEAYNDILERGKLPILCGGTGLYIEAVLKGYNLSPVPQNAALREDLKDKTMDELTAMLAYLKQRNGSRMHNTTDVDTCQRAIRAIEIETYIAENEEAPQSDRLQPAESLIIGVDIDRQLRREKISRRLRQRLDEGMVDEVRGLLAEGIAPEDLIYYGLEYKYLTMYVIGQLEYDEMVRQLEIAIHQFAKRQMTWFRGMERRGLHINWIPAPQTPEEMQQAIDTIITLKETSQTI